VLINSDQHTHTKEITMRAIIKAALAIDELAYDLENISADDKNAEDLRGENGPTQKVWAKGQVRKLKALIKKFAA
jgi:hypothetical protein